MTLLAAPQSAQQQQSGAAAQQSNPSPARESVTPDKRAEDRPAHESPYSAFSAPHAKRVTKKRSVKCADGTLQTRGQRKDKGVCEGHGGVKQ